MADFAIRLALRDHLLSQIREIHASGRAAAPRLQQIEPTQSQAKSPPPPVCNSAPHASPQSPSRRTLLPESCATKLYESAIALKGKDLKDAEAKAFQALSICDFTLGPNSPQSMVILEHIATICDAQGNHLGADMMRANTFAILFRGRPSKGKAVH